MLNKYRLSNIFLNYIQYNILKNRLMLFIKQVWPSLNHTSEMIALSVFRYSLELIKSILQHKAQAPANIFGSRAILSYKNIWLIKPTLQLHRAWLYDTASRSWLHIKI